MRSLSSSPFLARTILNAGLKHLSVEEVKDTIRLWFVLPGENFTSPRA
ncbi:predicted protein [Botrytis cinerea T4]|uniref:Uncharacterized protein n=1 Tax=Botryotinia fuckeliana (strain T4) TaxID=999810 RepID=G2XZU7_BOTF4|nr:predicted protein [Botrytis cinerea T4]